jgi:hypothetical protein
LGRSIKGRSRALAKSIMLKAIKIRIRIRTCLLESSRMGIEFINPLDKDKYYTASGKTQPQNGRAWLAEVI